MTDLLEVRLPDIGDLDGVSIVEILVEVGQAVEADAPLVTLESDKASMEIPSPSAGVVSEVLIAVGDSVSEETVLLTLSVAENQAAGDPEPDQERSPTVEPKAEPDQGHSEPEEPVSTPSLSKPEEPVSTPSLTPITSTSDATAVHASPGIRRFARQLGVDLRRVSGSGRSGRILREDVQQFVKQELSSPTPVTSGFEWPEVPTTDFSRFGPVEQRPLGRIQKISARNLHRSWINVPHVTQFDKADITELEAFRRRHKDEAARLGIKLTLLSFLMKACAVALDRFPEFRSSLDPSGDSLIIKNYFHLGIAVDTENGLVVPVVRDVDQKSLYQLGRELGDVSQRAREGKLTPQDFQGGCFTISSLGGIGGTAFTPIVNAPEVAILGVSRAADELSLVDGKIQSKLMLPLSLSYDHRVIDGALAARFIVHLSSLLGDIGRMIL